MNSNNSSSLTNKGLPSSGCDFLSYDSYSRNRFFFITEELTEEQKMIKQGISDFCKKEIHDFVINRGREIMVTDEKDRKLVIDLLKKAGELGFCSISTPEKYGGMDLDTKTNMLFAEYSTLGAGFCTTLLVQISIGCLPIVFFGNEEQKAKYLPKIASCEYISAYALTEPQSGSDANSGKTKAILSEDGKYYTLNGQKMWISNGSMADVFIVFAKIDNDENLSAFIVEKAYGGIEIGEEEKKMGIKGSSTTQIFFTDCKVPAENLLGERDKGIKIALNILNNGRLKAGSGGFGTAKYVLDRSITYSLEREQFGQSISNFGAIKEKIAKIAYKTFANEATGYRISDNIDNKVEELTSSGMEQSKAKVDATREYLIEASLLKFSGTELGSFAADEGIQIFGGMGYAMETGLEGVYRDVRVTRIYEGTNEINRLIAIGELLKRSSDKNGKVNLKEIGKKIPKFIFSTYNPFSQTSIEKNLTALKYSLIYLIEASVKKYKKDIKNHQQVLLRLSDILLECYLAESTYLKLLKMESKNTIDKEKLKVCREMTEMTIHDANTNVRRCAREILLSVEDSAKSKKSISVVERMLSTSAPINPIKNMTLIADYFLKKKRYFE